MDFTKEYENKNTDCYNCLKELLYDERKEQSFFF